MTQAPDEREAIVLLLPVPNWWRPGRPLPHLTASVTYTGTGKLRSGGRVTTTRRAVAWDWEEYKSRVHLSEQGEG